MKILIVDDEAGVRRSLTRILEDEGYEAFSAPGGEKGLELASRESPPLVLCDVRMPDMDGLEFLRAYRQQGGQGLVIMITAYGSSELAVEAMKKGAYDYLPKPFSADEMLLTLKKAEEREELRHEVNRLRREVPTGDRHPEIVTRNARMTESIEMAEKAARHPTTVLVTGESGTGKELIARLIHRESPRASGPFVPINCGAIPENLLESELFGHAEGAFTGAGGDRTGLFEEADVGTILLDEVAELPQPLQVKLLRVLEEGEVRRVGESGTREVDVRVVAATARDLETEVAGGRFRSDLFYRINVVQVHLPPLHHRSEDIPLLTRHFLDKYRRMLGIRVDGVTPPAMKKLMDYRWPGNVRELKNVIERAAVLSEGEKISVEDLPAAVTDPDDQLLPSRAELPEDELSIKKHSAELERRLISRALEVTGGNRTRAADLVDLSYRALLYKIREYGLDED